MDRSDTTEGLGNPGESAESYFHPLPGVLFQIELSHPLKREENLPQVL
jgi:hypothetical protein